jgi:hypothetical protein
VSMQTRISIDSFPYRIYVVIYANAESILKSAVLPREYLWRAKADVEVIVYILDIMQGWFS